MGDSFYVNNNITSPRLRQISLSVPLLDVPQDISKSGDLDLLLNSSRKRENRNNSSSEKNSPGRISPGRSSPGKLSPGRLPAMIRIPATPNKKIIATSESLTSKNKEKIDNDDLKLNKETNSSNEFSNIELTLQLNDTNSKEDEIKVQTFQNEGSQEKEKNKSIKKTKKKKKPSPRGGEGKKRGCEVF